MMSIDWQGIFLPTVSLLEILIRGSIFYLAIFFFLRFLPPRAMGGLSLSDVLVVVLIADAAQNGMSADYRSITEGLLLVMTIILWSYFIDTLDFYFPKLRLTSNTPVLLIKNGKMLKANMKSEKISESELMSQIRQYGLDTFDDVKCAYMEGDGHISVIVKSHLPTKRGI